MNIKIKKLHPGAIVPTYGTEGAACFDLAVHYGQGYIQPNEHKMIKTGLAFEIPKGYVMLIFPRSSWANSYSLNLMNCVGVIDSDYRGEVSVLLRNNGSDEFCVEKSQRIAQAMILPVQQVAFEVVDELSDTQRGAGGFGSTGK